MLMLRALLIAATTSTTLLLAFSARGLEPSHRVIAPVDGTVTNAQVLGSRITDASEVYLAQASSEFPDVLYQRPSGSGLGAPAGTTSTGSRGEEKENCDSFKSGALTLLAPVDHAGVTASGRPTFFWYFTKVPAATVEFTLQEADGQRPSVLIRKIVEKPQVGLNQLKMPDNIPELIPGQKYYWSIDLTCNPNRPLDTNILVETDFRRAGSTAISPQTIAQLDAAQSERDRARIYAQDGYWYDALSNILVAQSKDPKNVQLNQAYLSLLEQAGLGEVAKQERLRLSLPAASSRSSR